MAHLSLRIDDDIAEAVGVLAKAAGMSRSAWIARAIKDALEGRPEEARDVPASSEGGYKALHLRLLAEEVAAIDRVAQQAGLSRSQWVKRTLRWQLWTRAGKLRLVPSSYRSIMKIVGQVRKIGYSLNQSVKAMNAAKRPESPLIIERVAGDVLAMEERLSATIKEADGHRFRRGKLLDGPRTEACQFDRDCAVNAFEFSDRTLEDLERVQGAGGAKRGKVDHRGNRALARDLSIIIGVPGQIAKGVSGSKSARNAHALQQIARTAKRAPQVMVKITSCVRGSASTVGAFTYVGRIGMADKEPIGIETSEGKHLMSAEDMLALAREWQQWETADKARRQGATAIAMVFLMPPGTDPEKVRDAVKDFAQSDLANRRWAMALHTDEDHPHVHLLIANRDNDGRRFNPNREFLQHCRDRFAQNLRDRGIEADATKRMARGYPPKQDPTPF